MDRKYNDVTVWQIELMKHAIGFDDSEVTGIKHRVVHAYRNYFSDRTNKNWEKLVELGLATKSEAYRDGGFIYYVSLEGLNFLGKLFRCKIVETR